MVNPVKLNWVDTAIQIHTFHVAQIKSEPQWTLEKTAKALNRSTGSVSEYLLLASFLHTYEKQLRRIKSVRDAIAFVRSKQREILTRSLEL